MPNHAVEFRNVIKRFDQTTVVRNINLQIPRGRLVTLIGPSGCGKTTSLKMVNRLIDPTNGDILVDGENVMTQNPVELRRNIGYVIQHIGLFPHMTIEENITLVPRLKGEKKHSLLSRTEELLNLVGLDPVIYRNRYPRELSGGQQQRIGVARALAADPNLILMDEPFSALDPISREQLQDELVKLQSAVKKTILFVTHDMDEALKIADQIVLMRDGEIIQSDTPDQLLRHPKDDFVREFVGEKRFSSVERLLTVEDVLTNAVTIAPGRGLAEAIVLMQKRHVNGLIVTDQFGQYLGVLGPKEIYANYGDEMSNVSGIMTKNAPIVTLDVDLPTVLQLLEQEGRGYLPVLDHRERLLGVVTRASVISAMVLPFRNEVIANDPVMANPLGKLE